MIKVEPAWQWQGRSFYHAACEIVPPGSNQPHMNYRNNGELHCTKCRKNWKLTNRIIVLARRYQSYDPARSYFIIESSRGN